MKKVQITQHPLSVNVISAAQLHIRLPISKYQISRSKVGISERFHQIVNSMYGSKTALIERLFCKSNPQ